MPIEAGREPGTATSTARRWWQAPGALERRPWGLALCLLALAGLVIACYLEITKLAGGLPVCGPGGGCETVALSPYSEVFGIPVEAYGIVYSVALLGVCLAWWRGGDRRWLYAAYGMGLVGLFVEAYLVYLELFVIHAVCVWCVGYGVTVILGWLVAMATLARTGRQPG